LIVTSIVTVWAQLREARMTMTGIEPPDPGHLCST